MGGRVGLSSLSAVSVIDALFWVVSLVLVAAGASKLAEPAPVASTLAALGPGSGSRYGRGSADPRRAVPSSAPAPPLLLARLVGAVEVIVGLLALVVGGPVAAAAVALAYASFAVVVVIARRRGLPSCGCFGVSSAPPSRVHVAVNVVSAAVAAAAAVGGGPVPVADGLSDLGGVGVVVAGLVLLATVLVVAVDTTVADVVEATRALAEQGDTGQGHAGPLGTGQEVGTGGDRMGVTA